MINTNYSLKNVETELRNWGLDLSYGDGFFVKRPEYMVKSLKLIVVLDFSYMTINSVMGSNLPVWFLPVFLGLTFGDLIFWLVKLVRIK